MFDATKPPVPTQVFDATKPPNSPVSIMDTLHAGNRAVKKGKILAPANFHPYQKDMIRHIVANDTANLWVFLGGGKSVATLTAFEYLQRLGLASKMLIIAPKKVCELTWDDETTKWSHLIDRKFRFSKILGSAKQKQNALFASNIDIYITNYESIPWLIGQLDSYFIREGVSLPFDMLVWDEVSKMKNSTSNRFKAVLPLLPYFNRRIGLTASPASNGLQNTWAQSFVTDLGARLGNSYTQFLSKYFHQEGGQYGKWLPYEEGETRDMIVRQLHDNTLQIHAEGNIVLPPLHEEIISVTLSAKNMKEYLELEQDFFIELDSGVEVDVFNSASLASKLLQFANGIMYNYPDPTNPEYRDEIKIHVEKYRAFDELYYSTGDEPIFLFYNHTSELRELQRRYPDAECIVGADEATSISIRDRFNNGELKLLITHAASAGYGLNLQGACSIVCWFGLGHNQELYEQGIGRVYRQGQTKPVRLVLILAKDTRDYMVYELLHDKTDTQNKLKNAMSKFRLKLGL